MTTRLYSETDMAITSWVSAQTVADIDHMYYSNNQPSPAVKRRRVSTTEGDPSVANSLPQNIVTGDTLSHTHNSQFALSEPIYPLSASMSTVTAVTYLLSSPSQRSSRNSRAMLDNQYDPFWDESPSSGIFQIRSPWSNRR